VSEGAAEFIRTYGWRVRARDLAAVLGCSADDVKQVRRRVGTSSRATPARYDELFAAWHGRAPTDAEWPTPALVRVGQYEWLPNEDALVASLVGRLSVGEIAQTLTARLRMLTADQHACRTPGAVQNRLGELGLQTTDLVGGLSVAEAAREIGSRPVVQQAIRDGRLRPHRVGRLLLIPYAQWNAWKAERRAPPEGMVPLSSLREALGIRSDSKLPEFAKLGYIPTATLHVYDVTKVRGEWYVSAAVAETLLADRRAGRPMPWHGKPLATNLRATYRLWCQRKHPDHCETCKQIWGEDGAPQSYDAYVRRYPPLAHGAKRHLTLVWSQGLTLEQVAEAASCEVTRVREAVDNGVLQASIVEGVPRVTRSDSTRWIARRCPAGDHQRSWVSLAWAEHLYLFTADELHRLMESGMLRSKVGTDGAMRGVTYVLKQQLSDLRARLGFTMEQGAARVGVGIEQFRELLQGVDWRAQERVPLTTLQAVIKRYQSCHGWGIDEAAIELGTPASWVRDQVAAGIVKLSCTSWNPDRPYLTLAMMNRLRTAMEAGDDGRSHLGPDWLHLSTAAAEAGVAPATILRWHQAGDLLREPSASGWRYDRATVRRRARRYWSIENRRKRAVPPSWFLADLGVGSGEAAEPVGPGGSSPAQPRRASPSLQP